MIIVFESQFTNLGLCGTTIALKMLEHEFWPLNWVTIFNNS